MARKPFNPNDYQVLAAFQLAQIFFRLRVLCQPNQYAFSKWIYYLQIWNANCSRSSLKHRSLIGRSKKAMSVAEKTAVPNLSQIRGKIRLVTAIAVMGVLIVMMLPSPTMAMDFPISQNIAISFGTLLVFQFMLQRINFSVCPSLFLINVLWLSSPDGWALKRNGGME